MKETRDGNRKKASVYSYIRWSSDGQADGDSQRRQTQMAENWCARRGLSLTGTEKDDGVSAWNGKNRSQGSGLSRLLKVVRPGDYLLIEDLDRLSRQDWRTAVNFVAEIVDNGVTLVTLNNSNEITGDRFASDPGCFLPAVLRAFLGNDENEKKSKRIKESWAARKKKLASGTAAKTNLPCWLAWDDDVDKPVLIEHNAATIRKMFTLALQGAGCQTIARQLHEDGDHLVVVAKRQRRERRLSICTSHIWRILRNKMVIGFATYVQPHRPGVYPAAVDEQTFYAVQHRLEANKHQTTRRATRVSSLFTGIAFCSTCGGRLCRFTQCRHGKVYRYLICSDALHKNGKCGAKGVRYDEVEQSFLQLLSQTDLVREALNETRPIVPTRLDSLCGQLADSEHQIAKLMTLMRADPNPSPAVYQAVKDEEAKASDLRDQIEVERAKVTAENSALERYEDFQARFAGRMLEPQFRAEVKTLLLSFIDRIIVHIRLKRYYVHFKGAKIPIEAQLHPEGGCLFSPAPQWLLDPKAQEEVAAVIAA